MEEVNEVVEVTADAEVTDDNLERNEKGELLAADKVVAAELDFPKPLKQKL